MDIENLRALCQDEKIKWTIHALKRIRERKISAGTVIDTIMTGNIIKQYQDDKPFPSCLIFYGASEPPLHVVASSDGVSVYIITAYIPTIDEWESDYVTRKEQN